MFDFLFCSARERYKDEAVFSGGHEGKNLMDKLHSHLSDLSRCPLCPDPLTEERRVREYSCSEFSSIYSYFFSFFFSFYCSGPQGIKHHLTFFSGMSKGVSSNRVLANSLPLQLSNVILPDLSLLFSA